MWHLTFQERTIYLGSFYTEMHLNAMNSGDIIKEINQAFLQDYAKALIFPRHHLHESLKNEYLTVNDHFTQWSNLKERYDHQKTMIHLKA